MLGSSYLLYQGILWNIILEFLLQTGEIKTIGYLGFCFLFVLSPFSYKQFYSYSILPKIAYVVLAQAA